MGHGLADPLLLEVILEAARTAPQKHRIVVVNPGEKSLPKPAVGGPVEILLSGIKRLPAEAHCLRDAVRVTTLDAESYMARLRRHGLAGLEAEARAPRDGKATPNFGLLSAEV